MQCPVLACSVLAERCYADRVWYAMCGTEIGYAATRPRGAVCLRPTRCHSRWLSPTRVPGTDILNGAPYATPSTGIACSAVSLRVCYAMPGTEVVFGAVRY
eukprot:585794-Rhodomonas_salina.1